MPVNVVFNGVTYSIPVQGDPAPWGPPLTRYLVALAAGALSPSGGSFPLTADVNFGPNFGLISKYFTSFSSNSASSGSIRLANTDTIDWRNFANTGNNALGVNTSDQLTYNGTPIQSAITTGNLTDGGTDGIIVTGGTGAVIGTGTSLAQHVADSTHNGYLSFTDWTTFNSKQTSGNYITALTGDVTATGPGSVAATLATVNASPGTTTLSSITTNGKGLVTSNTSATLTSGDIFVGNGSNVPTAVALSGAATLANTGALTLATVNSNVGSFTSANITVNAKGLITAASNGGGSGTVTSVSGTANQIDVATGTTTPVISIDSTFIFPGTISANSHKITSLSNGTVSTDAAAFGQILGFRILQVVSSNTATTTTSSSATYTDATNLNVTITPTLSTSTIWIFASVACLANNSSSQICAVGLRIIRGSSTVVNTYPGVCELGGGSATAGRNGTQVLLFSPDSPATTSATTYKIQMNSGNATATASVNEQAIVATGSFIYAIEVG